MTEFCCPNCKQALNIRQAYYTCEPCRIDYRQYVGIPNFKQQELYPGEWKLLEEFEQKYSQASFIELMEYMDSIPKKNVLPCELRRHQRFAELNEEDKRQYLANYTKETIVKPGKLQLEITQFLINKAGYRLRGGRCLDIGCGRGPWAVTAVDLFDEIFALDVDMASLILAKKYCQENDISNIQFLSATASALPFSGDYFELINSQAVLEHVDDQARTLKEIKRVLQPGGCFTGDSINRYNLFTPEPHIELRLIGFLPKNLAHKLSLWLRKLPYDDIKPLSYNELRLLLRQAFDDHFKIVPLSESPDNSLTYKVMRRLPAKLLNLFTHTHYIIALKNNR